MENTTTQPNRKITIRKIAAGSTIGWGALQLPLAKTALVFTYYGYFIDMWIPINAIMFLTMISFGVITGGTYLTKIKGNGES